MASRVASRADSRVASAESINERAPGASFSALIGNFLTVPGHIVDLSCGFGLMFNQFLAN